MESVLEDRSAGRIGFLGMVKNNPQSQIDYHLENLDIKGYTVMENVLSHDECVLISEKMDCLNTAQIKKFGKERLDQLSDYGVIRDMLCVEPCFRSLIVHSAVLPIVENVIGPTAILHLQNGVLVEPNMKHYQAFFHRDFAKDFVCEKVLALNAMFVIDDFNAETGATWVVPFTHRMAKIPSDRYLEENAIQIQAKAGSVFFFDGLLIHKSGENFTNKPRRAVNHEYTRPFIKQQLDFAGLFRGQIDHESKLAQILGLWSMPPRSVEEYRVDPDKRTYRKGQG